MSSSLFRSNNQALSKILDGVSAGVSRGAQIIEEEAKANAPVLTGELRDSIHAQAAEQDKDLSGSGNARTAVVTVDAEHGPYVEYGTGERGMESPGAGQGPYSPTWKGMPAQPYLRPALDTRRQDVLEAIGAEVASATS